MTNNMMSVEKLIEQAEESLRLYKEGKESESLAVMNGTYQSHEYFYLKSLKGLKSLAMYRKKEGFKGNSWNFRLSFDGKLSLSVSASRDVIANIREILGIEDLDEVIVPIPHEGEDWELPKNGSLFAQKLILSNCFIAVDSAADSNGRFPARDPKSVEKHGGAPYVTENYTLYMEGAEVSLNNRGKEGIIADYIAFLKAGEAIAE